jgi:hypothetical protein
MVHRMILRLASFIVMAALACGCGRPSHTQLRAGRYAPLEPPRGTREQFEPRHFDLVFENAVRAMHARGLEIVACDPEFGSITTSRTEVDAPCGESTCLARETTTVKLGYRRARVTLKREIWDATLHEWREPDDRTSVETIDRVERELVGDMVGGRLPKDTIQLEDACGASSRTQCVIGAPLDD